MSPSQPLEEPQGVSCFCTPLGWMAIRGHAARLCAVALGYGTSDSALRAVSGGACAVWSRRGWNGELVERLRAYTEGDAADDFLDVEIDLTGATFFQRRVLETCRQVRPGETISYAALATRAGFPAAARAVGSVMARNRMPLVVPCHRIIAAGGRLGGYSAPAGLRMKRRLLTLEQATLVGASSSGKVVLTLPREESFL